MSKSIVQTVPAFIAVGIVGFLVDLAGLQVMLALDFDAITARVLSFPIAVVITWVLHRRFTFSHRRRKKRTSELSRYMTAQIVSALLGFAAYTTLVLHAPLFGEYPALALVVSSIIGAIINYVFSHFVVFNETGGSA